MKENNDSDNIIQENEENNNTVNIIQYFDENDNSNNIIQNIEENNNSSKIIQHLFDKDLENKTCVHCKSPMPTFASINNAIIICQECAEKHRALGFNISYVRELKDDWDPYLLSFLEMGGNSRFIRFSKKYGLDDISIEDKFYTKISEYYRLLVNIHII